MSKLYLQNIIDDIPFENLPAKWQGLDFGRFSKDLSACGDAQAGKTLFDFQKDALQNALKALHLYFKETNAAKKAFFEHYKLNGLEENFDYNVNRERKTVRYLLDYPDDYPVVDNKISFAHFSNRMSFWMATGSGKTLIIVKLIEFLGKLIAEKELPARDILFLAHRDDLLDQFKNHVDEFNSFNFDTCLRATCLPRGGAGTAHRQAKFEFEELDCVVNTDLISKLDYKDILKYVLNAKTPGNIEVLKIPGNKNELIFRLMTADKPFALIKIGDISGWLKEKLGGYEINESFENESYFRRINRDDSDINVLMGSRSFYEG